MHTRNTLYCSFCGKNQHEVRKLIAGPTVFICDECVELCTSIVREGRKTTLVKSRDGVPEPHDICKVLDDYVIGQDHAKRVVSVAVHNHCKRLAYSAKNNDAELAKPNILLVGPTGLGKTLFAHTLARIIGAPFTMVDATMLTEAGYVGEDVKTIIISKLVQAADYNAQRARRGVVYIDEVDKISRKSDNPSVARDVSGEGVQQALLKIMEGTIVSVPPQGGRKHPQQEFLQVDTTNILFVCGGTFAGLEKIIAQRRQGTSIRFGAEVRGPDERKTGEILKDLEPEDLLKFGLIPEFVGRLRVVATLEDLQVCWENPVVADQVHVTEPDEVMARLLIENLRAGIEKLELRLAAGREEERRRWRTWVDDIAHYYRNGKTTTEKSEKAAEAEWSTVLGQLRAEVGEDAFRHWLQPMKLERVEVGLAVIAAPTRFLRDWVATHYADRLLALWQAENEQVRRLSIIVSVTSAPANGNHYPDDDAAEQPPPLPNVAGPAQAFEIGDDRAQLLALDHRFVFENFVVGKPNDLAHAAARRVAETCVSSAHTVPFNPLFLYGGVGVGKTHLMHAMAWHVRKHASARKIIYLSAEKFMYQFIQASRSKSTMDFEEQFRSVDLLMIDDVQFISGKDTTQEEFFYICKTLIEERLSALQWQRLFITASSLAPSGNR